MTTWYADILIGMVVLHYTVGVGFFPVRAVFDSVRRDPADRAERAKFWQERRDADLKAWRELSVRIANGYLIESSRDAGRRIGEWATGFKCTECGVVTMDPGSRICKSCGHMVHGILDTPYRLVPIKLVAKDDFQGTTYYWQTAEQAAKEAACE